MFTLVHVYHSEELSLFDQESLRLAITQLLSEIFGERDYSLFPEYTIVSFHLLNREGHKPNIVTGAAGNVPVVAIEFAVKSTPYRENHRKEQLEAFIEGIAGALKERVAYRLLVNIDLVDRMSYEKAINRR